MNENKELRDQPIFVCGHPKSGTTLLMSLFDSHSQLVVYPIETFFFRGFIPEIRNRDLEEKLSLAQRYLLHYIARNFNNPGNQNSGEVSQDQRFLDYARMCELMLEDINLNGIRHDGDFLSAAIYAYGLAHNKLSAETLYWIEKTPYNEHFAELIFKWWPEAHCIHIVRDPRDNYLTYQRKHKGLSAEDFSLGWNSSIKVGFDNRERYGKKKYMLLRYEELTTNTEKSLGKIIDFLGISDEKILRIPTSDGVPWEGNSQFDEKFRGISTKPVGRWKRDLSGKNIEIIDSICAESMNNLGYEVQNRSRMKSFIYIFGWTLKQIPALPGDISKVLKQRFGMLPHE
jgi:hypothetical protein